MNYFVKSKNVFSNFSKKPFNIASNSINYSCDKNPRVFLTVSKDEKILGNLTFELYANHCKLTAENFRQLCVGSKDKLTYKGNDFHRIINEFMVQGGDITKGNGTGGMSIYGRNFPDENLKLKHYKRGMLSMANSGPDTNGSQFFITFKETSWLDAYHVVFGELVEGENILREIEAAGSRDGTPKAKISITDCGEVAAKH